MPKLVLLPGLDGTGRLFKEFIAALPPGYSAVPVRYPETIPLDYMALDEIVRAACPSSESFTLVAESFSTPLAIRLAATNPANLQSVVLCAGFAMSPRQGLFRWLASLIAPLLFRIPLPGFAVRYWLVGRDASPDLVADVQLVVGSVMAGVLAARLRAVLSCDVRAELGKVAVPVLYLQAGQDRLVDASVVEVIRECGPSTSVVVLDGPHLLLQRHPRAAAGAIVQFVELGS